MEITISNYSTYTTGSCNEPGVDQERCQFDADGERKRLVEEHVDSIIALYDPVPEPCFNSRQLGEEPFGFELACIRARIDDAIQETPDISIRTVAISTFMELVQCGVYGFASDGTCLDDSYRTKARQLAEREAGFAESRNTETKDHTALIAGGKKHIPFVCVNTCISHRWCLAPDSFAPLLSVLPPPKKA